MANYERYVVLIDEVSTENNLVYAYEGTSGGRITIPLYEVQGGIIRIPQKGELWNVVRYNRQWYLGGLFNSQENEISQLAPGDFLLNGATLHLNVDRININGRPVAPTKWDRIQITTPMNATGTTQVALSDIPISSSCIQAYNNGTLIDPSTIVYKEDATIISISPTITVGNIVVIYYQYMDYEL